jgi:hypothetical protein
MVLALLQLPVGFYALMPNVAWVSLMLGALGSPGEPDASHSNLYGH